MVYGAPSLKIKEGVPVTHGRSRPTTAKDESCEQVRLQTQAPYNGIHLLAYDRVVVLSDASCKNVTLTFSQISF